MARCIGPAISATDNPSLMQFNTNLVIVQGKLQTYAEEYSRVATLVRSIAYKLFGVTQRLGRESLAGKHSADLTGPRLARKLVYDCNRAALHFFLFDDVMMGCESGDLCKVRHA